MDFDVDYEDTNGVTRPVPRKPVLPSWDGILGILREASAGGGSGFVHFGGHCMYTTAGTSNITQLKPYRYTETANGSPVMEAFIVTTDGRRLYGREFIEALGDGADKRYGTTLTISFDMCNASAFLAGVVQMPCQYRGEGIQEPAIQTTRDTNQLALMNGGSAADVIKHVHDMCQGQPKKHLLQTPQITSRYQLTGTFGLLPTQHSML
ncbi:hypothetical protein FRC04_001439 [Tulasnella sp. 424]|nr:hypothetical protein FRC04_001439 [Tulasnella sp. 424]